MTHTPVPRPASGGGTSQSGNALTEIIAVRGCEVTVREVTGPVARELFLHCQPGSHTTNAVDQAEAVYAALHQVLQSKGSNFLSVVSETVFHRSLAHTIVGARAARDRVVSQCGDSVRSVVTEVAQPSLDRHVWLEVQVHAVLTAEPASRVSIECAPACDCIECRRTRGVVLQLGQQSKFYSGAIYGKGDNACEQTHAMFSAAEEMLKKAGMQFKDVVRTWIYLEQMERDYPKLNLARREFFNERGIHPPPASTGIGAGLVPAGHSLCLGVIAVKSEASVSRTLMTTPTLNEAPQYGADFSRGMRVDEDNAGVLYVSGTASLNEQGQSIHRGDFESQVERMLLNVKALLDVQGADFHNIVTAITYVKHEGDAAVLRAKLRDAGYHGFPNALVVAPVCRPELLCETEALAIMRKKSE